MNPYTVRMVAGLPHELCGREVTAPAARHRYGGNPVRAWRMQLYLLETRRFATHARAREVFEKLTVGGVTVAEHHKKERGEER